MKRFLGLLLAALTCAGPAFACDIASDQERLQVADYVRNGWACLENPPEGFRFDEQIEQAFVDRINSERLELGLPPLSVRTELLRPARIQSLDIGVNGFSGHLSSDGRGTADRIAAFDRTLLTQSVGENIAVFAPAICYDLDDIETPCPRQLERELPTRAFVVDDLHQKLMRSEGHQANILSKRFTHLAVGVARTDTGFYVTQVFANLGGELSVPMPMEFEISSALDLSPDLMGWKVEGYAVVDTAGELTNLDDDLLERLDTGDKSLTVIGYSSHAMKRGSTSQVTTEWIHLSGPSFTLSAAKGS